MTQNTLPASEDALVRLLVHGRVARVLRRRGTRLFAQIRGSVRAVRLALSGNRVVEPLG